MSLLFIGCILAGLSLQKDNFRKAGFVKEQNAIAIQAELSDKTRFTVSENLLTELNENHFSKNKNGVARLFSNEPAFAKKSNASYNSILNSSDGRLLGNYSGERMNSFSSLQISIAGNELMDPKKKGSLVNDFFNNNPVNGDENIHKTGQRFYWGIVAGPQFNEVKHQGMKKAGMEGGVLIGYKLKERLALESGILFSKKYYFSEGKYFDMGKMGSSMPPDMKILSLQGSSSVFEIPVRLKFDLVKKNDKRLFVTGGVSSYLLVQEKNDYHTMMNGTEDDMTASYKKAGSYAAAALHLGAGYEQKLSKRNYLRIEPYIQVPIQGIGVGAMPVTSAGLRIGIFRN
jgi:hypothetical protein